MLPLIRIRVKYLIRNPCLLFWSYLFLPALILAIAIYQLLSEKPIFKKQLRESPYKIDELYFNETSILSYQTLSRYWPATLFVADNEQECAKIRDFFDKSNIYQNINCSTIENAATNKTENIIKIEKKSEKYRIYLNSRKNDINDTNKGENIMSLNTSEFQGFIEIINELNITGKNLTDINELLNYLKNVKISDILNLLNISSIDELPDIPGIPIIPEIGGSLTIGDILELISTLNKTKYESLNKIFTKSDLDQDTITDAFYVSNKTSNDSKSADISSIIGILLKSSDKKYQTFFELQSLFANLLISLEKKEVKSQFKMIFGLNSYPDHYRFTDEYGKTTYTFLSFVIALQFSLIAYNFNLRMIDEKENKLNILLERQGISKFKYNLSWLITYYALFLLSIVAFILFLLSYAPFHSTLNIINIIMFSLSIYCVCIFFTTCIQSTKTGTTAVKFYNFGSILLGFVIVLPKTSKFTKIVFSFIPQINLFSSLCTIFNLNNFENLSGQLLRLKAAKMSIIEVFLMYFFEIIFYLGLSIFIQSYKDSGLNFISYLKSYYTKVSRKSNVVESILIDNTEHLSYEVHHQELSPANQEKSRQHKCLKLENVSKNFGDLKAVDCFNGELFPNEIFCLLGHNGAGKSTTINMISGIIDPDHGDIKLNDRSLVTDKDYLYQNIGLCQQEDIYFDYLTVEEHLQYMCRIKGSKINQAEIEELIDKIELTPKKNALCSTLSGGQKRKLCIALALIGDSQLILLDEPTSGMDVMARRSLWEFLKNYKKDKILLLTTHFLDEAEYLGDRIGIMSEGKYLCSGTSSFLKSKYPCGFNINLLINSSIFNEDYKNQFFNGIKEFEPNAEIKVASKGIFSINIQSNNQRIPEIFDFIENVKNQYGIEDYTVSSTSLEDVFLKINNKANLNDIKYLNKEENKDQMFQNVIPTSAGFFQQLRAQIFRGLYPLYRNKALLFFELLSGLGFIYIYIFFFSDFIKNARLIKLNLIEVLEAHNIYYYEKNMEEDFLKKSDTYRKFGTYITLKKLDEKEEPTSVEHFMNLAYDQALANIAKGSIYVNRVNNTFYEVYNTEVDNNLNGYLLANTMLFFSAFLKKEYDIDATIFPEITYTSNAGDVKTEALKNFFTDSIVLIIVCLLSLFGFVIFLGGLMFEKIKEKRTNIKHLLYLSGSNIFSYWIGFFIVDYIKLLFFDIFLIFPIFFVNGAAIYFGLDMLAISLSSLSFIYFISFFCSKDDEGAKILFIVVFGFLIIISLLGLVLSDILPSMLQSFIKLYYPHLFDFNPVTSMGLSFIRIILSYNVYDTLDKLLATFGALDHIAEFKELINKFSYGFGRPKDYLITSYIAQLLNLIIYSLLLVLAESGILGKLIHNIELRIYAKKEIVFGQPQEEDLNNINMNNLNDNLLNTNEDNNNQIFVYSKTDINDLNDSNNNNKLVKKPSLIVNNNVSSISNPLSNPYVQKEIQKLQSNTEFSTRITGLVKTFYSCCGRRNVRAINNLYLGLEPNEKFGLLGFNGSGKTTTFRAITNEILTDAGSVSLFNYDTKTNFEQIRTMIGYCPQINPLFDFMKVREIVKFYSDLKTCNETVESICQKFGLSKYLDTYTVNLSGGNKRKLTFAIAMMNKPSLLLLDEPSTGVDPESRRIMWRNINELSNTGHQYNMILTTHSMEEAEVLCDTVSWFKAGNFITKGNPEELKIQYSAGYKLHIKFDDNAIKQVCNPDLNGELINQTFNKLCTIIEGFDEYQQITQDANYQYYLQGLLNVLEKIRDKTRNISINLIGKDYSFELIISIIKEKQKNLFSEVLNMKNTDKTIAEMSIAMQSLENILTSLK